MAWLKLFLLVSTLVLVSGCTKQEEVVKEASVPKCKEPRIMVGGDCCLDENKDEQCDEPTTTTTRINCEEGSFWDVTECCRDRNGNEVCDWEECNPPFIPDGADCCSDKNDDDICDYDQEPTVECEFPDIQNGPDDCCRDGNHDGKCDVKEFYKEMLK